MKQTLRLLSQLSNAQRRALSQGRQQDLTCLAVQVALSVTSVLLALEHRVEALERRRPQMKYVVELAKVIMPHFGVILAAILWATGSSRFTTRKP